MVKAFLNHLFFFMARYPSVLLGVLLVLPLGAALSYAQEAQKSLPKITLRTGQHPTFERVVFDAPRGATYTVSRNGSAVVVRFSLAAHAVLSPSRLTKAKGFRAVPAQGEGQGEGQGLAIAFTVAPQAKIKDFMSDTSVVLDIEGQAAPDAPAPAATPEPAPSKPAAPAPEALAPVTPEPAPAPVQEKPPEEATPAEASPAANPAAVAEPAPEAQEPVAAEPEAAPTPEPPPAPAAAKTPLLNWPPPLTPALDSKTIEVINAIAQEKPPRPVAVFDPKTPVGVAVFARGGYVTVLFDRKLAGDALMTSPAPRVKLEPLELYKNTGFRLAIPDTISVRATRKDTAWEIYLVQAKDTAPLSTDFLAQPNFALGARLLLPSPSPPEPVVMRDPIVGDDLIIVPLKETGAFTIKRRLSDFLVVPAAQGLVIKPWHEKVTARVVPDGIEISAEGGLKLSPLRDMGYAIRSQDGAQKNKKELYDFKAWRGRDSDTFTVARQKLMQTIVSVPGDERVLARLDLARFYFAHGMGFEALAILDQVRKALPEIEAYPEFLAVRGGTYLLVGRVQDGLKDLSNPALKEQPDVVAWRAVGSALLREWGASKELFDLSLEGFSRYPEPLRTRFMVLAVEAALATDNDKTASEWLARAEKNEGSPESAKPAIHYLRGVLYSKAGHAEMAEKFWRMASRSKDRLYKIRAELALVDLGVATKSLTPKQAVDRLEGLRFAWRGDDLEFDILKRLGGYYLEAKDFKSGFVMLSQALRLFPQSMQGAALRQQMIKTFHDIYMTELGHDLSPIDALTLYTEYKSLIPTGEDGNDVRRNLAERLVDIDLLDQAGALLEDLIKNSEKPEEKAKTLTRLAAIKLLDHKGAEALALLDQSQSDVAALPQEIKDERQLLRARALSEAGKYQEALAALPAGDGAPTLLLRADIALRAKKWDDASKVLLHLVGAPKTDVPLSLDQTDWLIHAALAMAQGGDFDGLDTLATDFGAAMDKTPKGNLFKVITRPEKMTQMKDIYVAQSRLSEVDMFRSVLDSYRKEKK